MVEKPDPEEIRNLERELSAVREERMKAQRHVAEGRGVKHSLERTARDRSALTSAEVDALRTRVQELYDDLVESWDGVDRTRLMAGRLRRGTPGNVAPLLAVLDTEADGRADIARRAEEAGIVLRVPPPYVVGLLTAAERAARGHGDAAGSTTRATGREQPAEPNASSPREDDHGEG